MCEKRTNREDNLRRQFHQHARQSTGSSTHTAPGRLEPYYGNSHISNLPGVNESLPLLGNWNNTHVPLWKHDRAYIRWPMFTAHVIKEHLSIPSNCAQALLILVPLAIAGGVIGWP